MKIIIKSGRLVDPSSNTDARLDVLVESGKIKDIGPSIPARDDSITIDASGMVVLPGLIDMHVHFREPGRTDVETILGGSLVAAKSGFTSVCTMPNTIPPVDNPELVKFIKLEGAKGPINVFPSAAITMGQKGEDLSDMGQLIAGGAVAFTDDGKPVLSSILMRRALEYSAKYDVPLLSHAEDLLLTDNGIMNEGIISKKLGFRGIPNEAEDVMIARDTILAKLAGGRLHICHMSTKGAVKIVKMAKEEGVRITCETAPHYFSLTDEAVAEHLSMAKMKPPLRSTDDMLALIEALKSGIIDVIATDHAPHSYDEKMLGMEKAPFGIIGLETAVPLVITELIGRYNFSYIQAFSKMTVNPARILKIDRGELKKGGNADITVIDPNKKVLIDENFIISKCKNTPFAGKELYGSVEYTICNGKIVYSRK